MDGRLLNACPSTSKKDRHKPPYANKVESRCVHIKNWMVFGNGKCILYEQSMYSPMVMACTPLSGPKSGLGHLMAITAPTSSTSLLLHFLLFDIYIHICMYIHTYTYIHIYVCVCVFIYTLRLLLLLLFQVFPYEFRCGLYIWYKCVFYSILVPGRVWSPNCTWNVPFFFSFFFLSIFFLLFFFFA